MARGEAEPRLLRARVCVTGSAVNNESVDPHFERTQPKRETVFPSPPSGPYSSSSSEEETQRGCRSHVVLSSSVNIIIVTIAVFKQSNHTIFFNKF